MLIDSEMHFVDANKAFKNCFKTDQEREQYMYMHSEGDTHYFKNIDTRQYIKKHYKI